MFESVYSQENLAKGFYDYRREKHKSLEERLCARRGAQICDAVQGSAGAVTIGMAALKVSTFFGSDPFNPVYDLLHINSAEVLTAAIIIAGVAGMWGEAYYGLLYPQVHKEDRKSYLA